MVHGREEIAEEKERKLSEEEVLLKAIQRGELPQEDH